MSNTKKIVVIGPESTGKSTLSCSLAAHLQVNWVPEYARAYLENLGRAYTEADLLEIAKGQLTAENTAMEKGEKYLVCDTDLYVIKVWSEAKYGRCHPWILEQIAARKYDLYLLTYIDVIWTDDPLREHPLHEEREYFYNIYRDIVIQSGVVWSDIRGSETERLLAATNAVQKLL